MKKEKLQQIAKKRHEKNVLKMRKKVKTEIYPLLLKQKKSVKETLIILQAFSVGMQQAFIKKLGETKVSDLKLGQYVDKKSTYGNAVLELIELLQDCDYNEAKQMTEGFPKMISETLQAESEKKDFQEITLTFL